MLGCLTAIPKDPKFHNSVEANNRTTMDAKIHTGFLFITGCLLLSFVEDGSDLFNGDSYAGSCARAKLLLPRQNSEQEPEDSRRTELQYGLSGKDLALSSGGDDHY